MSKRAEALLEALEEAALAGAKGNQGVPRDMRGKRPDRLNRAKVAVGAVSGYTRFRASQNNMFTMMLPWLSRQTGVSAEQTLGNREDCWPPARVSGVRTRSAEGDQVKVHMQGVR